MDEGTKDSRAEELEGLLNAFCAKEYKGDRNPMTGKNFSLYACDSGGYDVTSDVMLNIVDGEITLVVATRKSRDYSIVESKTFKLRLEDG
jgi:hypothetical protein